MSWNRHKKWNEIMNLLSDIAEKHGSTIIDKRNGARWDVGQAVCADAYGCDWINNERFIEADRHPDSEPPDEIFYHSAVRMSKETPDWIDKE